MPRSVGEAVGRAWSAAVYAKPPRLASPCLASPRLPASLRVRSQRGYLYVSPTRLGARLDSARLGSGAHRMVEENWKEAARRVAAPRECDGDEGRREEGRAIPRKAPTSETLCRTVPRRPRRATPAGGYEPVAAVAAVNRAGALNPRRPRRSRSRPAPGLFLRARTTLSKRPDRFAKLRLRELSRRVTSTRKRRARIDENRSIFLEPRAISSGR